MTEVTPSEEETATVEVSELQEKCLTLPVQIAELKLRYLSGLTLIDQYTAESVFLTIGNPEKTGINIPVYFKNVLLLFLYMSV
jgi:hypothetical protein